MKQEPSIVCKVMPVGDQVQVFGLDLNRVESLIGEQVDQKIDNADSLGEPSLRR